MKYTFLLALCIQSFLCVSASKKDISQPNIIFILADDMGYSDMSWQGSDIQTPNLDKMKAEGMFLARNYVQPQCTPSRVAFLTGNYPYRYGLHEHIVMSSSYSGIPSEAKTVAEKMKEAGYKTAIVGKWHVGGTKQSFLPQNQGFDHSFVCINGAISYWNYTQNNGLHDLLRNGEKVYAPSKLDSEASGNQYSSYMWADEAIELIEGYDKDQPFFMYLSFNAPHHPLDAPQDILDLYPEEGIEAYWSGTEAKKGRTALARKYYMAMMDAMDRAIGEVIEAVDENGMKENTLIVFCSDNGGIIEGDNRPFRSFKGDTYEGGIRVPSIVYWPGSVKAGSTSQELVYVGDWYPTFAELAGVSVEEQNLDGVSAVSVIQGGKSQRKHITIVSEQRHALITPRYSLVGNSSNYQRSVNNNLDDFMLFDLQEDTAQNTPCLELKDKKAEMTALMLQTFPKVNRGYFNWDVMYGKYKKRSKMGDHSFDYVINDMPMTEVKTKKGITTVSVSPLCKKLTYTLQASADGSEWTAVDYFVCREDMDVYQFVLPSNTPKGQDYRVMADNHFGLPISDSFSEDEGYTTGPLYTASPKAILTDILPHKAGFLPVADLYGANLVSIQNGNLAYGNSLEQGGHLQVKNNNKTATSFLTRYFEEPLMYGKVYASMFVQYKSIDSESLGEVNFLVQNGWGGVTEKQVSIVLQNDAIYCRQADAPIMQRANPWVSSYDNEVVCLVFEFDLGPTGQDELHIYVNPEDQENRSPTASYKGEFTFDRLQFMVNGRGGGTLSIDELKVGCHLEDVMTKAEN